MKNLYPLLILLFLSLSIYAQSPDKMSYQAVVRDANNTLVANQTVGMQISILQSTITGPVVYTETHSVDTNLNGLVSLEIGNGSSSDNFSEIDWSAGTYFIKTETDPTGGSSYTITGTSQLMSVPFALYATTSGSSQTNATNITNNTTAIETNTIAIELNTAKVGITTEQSDAITANTAKVGITTEQSDAITANTAKVGYTDALVSANTDVVANTAKVGYTEALVSANTDVVANTAKVGVTTHAIGDSYGGGIVFFVYDGGQHGLIAATEDQSPDIRWYGGSDTNTRARADGIGAGLKNTAIIIANQGSVDGNAFAATVCNEYSVTADGVTYGDWYLPSKYELNLLNLQKDVDGLNFSDEWYWSSTELDSSGAWGQYFNNGSQLDVYKDITYAVRAVRAF